MKKIHAAGASDCFVYNKIGAFATYVPDYIENEKDLVEAFKNRNSNIYPVDFKKNTSLDKVIKLCN